MTGRRALSLTLAVAIVAAVAILASCGSSSSSSPQTGFVTTVVSDPPTCKGPSGPYDHVWVTVTDVQIHSSSGGNWVDLTPGLQPTQVDLLAEPSTECFLAMLGSKTELQAGTYEQIRINLADHGTKLQQNQCGSGASAPVNCVVLNPGNGGGTFELQLTSEAKNGLKIPSGQIAGGQFTIAGGETKDLDIDFDACASIVVDGNGRYSLKPVLHAGEVEFSSAINGKVIDANTLQPPLVGGTTVVALERRDNAGIDRVVMSTTTDASGAFALCPVPTGTYDLVAVAIDGAGTAYGATVVTGVNNGAAMGNIKLFPTTGANTSFATVSGKVLTSGASGATSEDVNLSALQQVAIAGQTPFMITVPLANQSLATATIMTQASSCDPSAACVQFSLDLPAVNPHMAAFGTSPLSYAVGNDPTGYTVDAQTLPLGTSLCTSGTETKSAFTGVSPGSPAAAGALSFTGCS
jgi:hypothetical protein